MNGSEGHRVGRRYLVRGRVQGVGFRAFTLRLAAEAGVEGWVRNLPDGAVEALAMGSPAELAAFEQGLRRGPGFARVDSLEARDEDPGSVPAGFRIAR